MMLLNQGFAALGSGDRPSAREHFAEGLGIARRLDDRVAQCYLIGGLACCAAGSREPRLAARLFGAMETLRAEAGASVNTGLAPLLARGTRAAAEALGRTRFDTEVTAGQRLDREDAVRLALSEPTPTVPDRDGATPLGRRGTEVAGLVAEGLTNKEIAARLFLSERTVESHVRTILTRLGFTSRAQIAAWVAAPDP
jgi:DNA-binding CsgD family transcriptional regulator